jgi:hypothetical protein
MMYRRHRHRSCFNTPPQFFNAGKGFATKLPGYRLGLGLVQIHYGHQLNALTLLLKFVINPGVVPAKSAHTYDSDPDWTLVLQALIFSEVIQSSKVYDERRRKEEGK